MFLGPRVPALPKKILFEQPTLGNLTSRNRSLVKRMGAQNQLKTGKPHANRVLKFLTSLQILVCPKKGPGIVTFLCALQL
jgi:NAD-dependent oxidoreductase involved in siderophore biosynthesis